MKTVMRPDTNDSGSSSSSDQIEMEKLGDEFIREKAQAAAAKLNVPKPSNQDHQKERRKSGIKSTRTMRSG